MRRHFLKLKSSRREGARLARPGVHQRRAGGNSESRAGVTLIELMVVVIVVGILASVAIPSYRKALERSYLREAEDLLLTIYTGQRAYFFLTGDYLAAPPADNWRDFHMDDPNITAAIPVSFVVNESGVTFTATAERSGGICNTEGLKTRTIDQDRVFAGNWPDCSGL